MMACHQRCCASALDSFLHPEEARARFAPVCPVTQFETGKAAGFRRTSIPTYLRSSPGYCAGCARWGIALGSSVPLARRSWSARGLWAGSARGRIARISKLELFDPSLERGILFLLQLQRLLCDPRPLLGQVVQLGPEHQKGVLVRRVGGSGEA